MAASAVCALALIAMIGYYLVYTDRAARERLHDDFGTRAAISGELTGSALTASDGSNRQFAEQAYSGDSAAVGAALDSDPTLVYGAVLDAGLSVVAARSGTIRGDADRLTIEAVARQTLRRGVMTLADVVPTPHGPLLLFGVPFTAGGRTRVLVGTLPADIVNTFSAGYLKGSLGQQDGHAYITDTNGIVLARTGSGALMEPIPDEPLRTALRRADSGEVGGDYFASAPVPGSGWRVILVTPTTALLAPIEVTRRVSWQIFAGLVLAMVGLTVLTGVAVTRSSRLAHERSHDSLTGLPNRTLFAETADRLLASAARRHEKAALLFIDLDDFKPINDTYGHPAGDAVLSAVAERLASASRSSDLACRFGGDEFLVLCTGLDSDARADEVAERLRSAIAEPITLDHATVRVGSSIGISRPAADGEPATALIQRADLAMYDAKRKKRGQPARGSLEPVE